MVQELVKVTQYYEDLDQFIGCSCSINSDFLYSFYGIYLNIYKAFNKYLK